MTKSNTPVLSNNIRPQKRIRLRYKSQILWWCQRSSTKEVLVERSSTHVSRSRQIFQRRGRLVHTIITHFIKPSSGDCVFGLKVPTGTMKTRLQVDVCFLVWIWRLTTNCRHFTTALSASVPSPSSITTIDGVAVHRVPLFRNSHSEQESSSSSPYCLVASTPPFDRPEINFLATQVWPSARTVAHCLHQRSILQPQWTVCELGCGPGLPSLTAARKCRRVIATDLDPFALKLVQTAAAEQGLPNVQTQPFDLVDHTTSSLPSADLYVLSDVFESSSVAHGAARVVLQALQQQQPCRVWVFAQSDRAQREVFLQDLQKHLSDKQLGWQNPRDGPFKDDESLWLCDVDETTVFYG